MGIIRGTWHLVKLGMISAILAVLVVGIGVAVGAISLLSRLERELPALNGIKPTPSITTKIYDVNGVLLDELFAEELREAIVPLPQIPRITQLAFIATEDQRFYSHYGVDPKRVLGALYADFVAKQAVQGASTITQQLAKNLFLTREKTMERKLKELLMAVRLERTYTKDEILELYLNTIFFGHRVFGIASAAKYYFGKTVPQLTLAESAVLAGLPKSPNRFSPFNRRWPNAWKDRQHTVLGLMRDQGYISHVEYDQAIAEPLKFQTVTSHSTTVEAPYFLEWVKRQLLDRFGFKRVFASGLKVYTTLDVRVQKMAEKHFLNSDVFRSKPLEDVPDFQGAMLVMDTNDGSVRAMIGGRDFEWSKFNRAVQARRHPGSSFKPFVYAAAFREGMSPSTTMEDGPTSFWDKGAQRWWNPANYGHHYYGRVTLAEAMAKSLNTIAVKLAEAVTPERVIELAQRVGVSSPLTPNLSIALGACEVTLLEMLTGYATFANQGIRVKGHGIARVEDSAGKVIWEAEGQEKEAVDERLAWTTLQCMRGVVEHGTAVRAKVPGWQLAGKTGTTQDFRDAWFIGTMPGIAAGAYVGYDEPRSMGTDMTGGRLFAPTIGAFLKEYVQTFPVPREFRAPAGTATISVCSQTHLLPTSGCPHTVAIAFGPGMAPTARCSLHSPLAKKPEAAENDDPDRILALPSRGSDDEADHGGF